MTFNLNEEASVIYNDFSELAVGIVTEINNTSIMIEDENINGSTTPTRIYLDQIDDKVA